MVSLTLLSLALAPSAVLAQGFGFPFGGNSQSNSNSGGAASTSNSNAAGGLGSGQGSQSQSGSAQSQSGSATGGALPSGTTAAPSTSISQTPFAETFSNSLIGVYTVTQDTNASIPLAKKKFPWPKLPEHADEGTGVRGEMTGYNICNDTTSGPNSLCMTGWLNDITDFCLWGAVDPNSVVGNVEQNMVSYCTKDTHGARLIPAGAITGVQFMRTPDYVQVVGFIDQSMLNIVPNVPGGEEDPHGDDGRGNPIGSLVYSNAFNSTNPNTFQGITQALQWSYFIGNNVFCYKVCDPNGPAKNSGSLCEHKFDEIGCDFNDPASYTQINGTFQACEGENQLPAGVFVSAGQTTTFVQGSTPPAYVASIPPSSNCAVFESANIYQNAAAAPESGGALPSGATAATPTNAPGSGDGSDGSDPLSSNAAPAATGTSGGARATATGQIASENGDISAATRGPNMGALGWTLAAGLSATVCGFALV